MLAAATVSVELMARRERIVEALPRIARRVDEVLPLVAVLERLAVVDTRTGEVHQLPRPV